jgi:AcrR family transcriptional regulator
MGTKERRKREERARLAVIIKAAESVFAQKGYHYARMDDIAEAAELAKGTLYYYFKSKDEIYFHLLEREMRKVHEELLRRISDTETFLEILEKWSEFYLDYFDENVAYLKMFLPTLCGGFRPEESSALWKLVRKNEKARELKNILKARIVAEGLPFGFEEIIKFLKTLQIGISFKLLEGNKAEARAAARFFLDLMKRIVEDRS